MSAAHAAVIKLEQSMAVGYNIALEGLESLLKML